LHRGSKRLPLHTFHLRSFNFPSRNNQIKSKYTERKNEKNENTSNKPSSPFVLDRVICLAYAFFLANNSKNLKMKKGNLLK
jgi:hypothetical protein